MRADVQCLSWWVRRLPNCEPAGLFFRDCVELPLLAQKGNNWDANGALFVFWGGEAIEFELMPGSSERPVFERPEQQVAVPVFRSFDYDRTLASVQACGGRVLSEADDPAGRTAYVLDPSGSINGLREPVPGSTDPVDVLARDRYDAGGTRLAGYKAMPPGVFDLGWVQLHVADVDAEVAFYRDVLGLDVLSSTAAATVLSLGDIARLEIKPGGARETPVPTDRADVPEMWMLRVRDMPAVVRDLKAAGVHFVNDPWWLTGGELAYFVDPEGHLVGIQDHPDDGRPQEQEAARRWAARVSR